jgi:nitrogen regulatory protein PII
VIYTGWLTERDYLPVASLEIEMGSVYVVLWLFRMVEFFRAGGMGDATVFILPNQLTIIGICTE